MLAASQRGCMINAIDCMYSKLPVLRMNSLSIRNMYRGFIGINLERKYIWLVLILQLYHDARSMYCQKSSIWRSSRVAFIADAFGCLTTAVGVAGRKFRSHPFVAPP